MHHQHHRRLSISWDGAGRVHTAVVRVTLSGIMRKSMTRHLTDFAQRGRGRQGQRFLFELRPSCVENIPGTLGDVVLSWQRGGKLQVTKVQPVDKAYSYVVFDDDTVLCMTTTIYKDNQHWLPKEYALKLQTVTRGKDGVDKTKTVAKYTLDFSCFCSLGASNESEAIEVNMKPFGKLYAQVKVQMLNSHAGPSDALSDMSFATGRQSVESREDQDLTGFGEEYPEMDTDNRENRTSAARTGAQAGSARKPPRANHRRTASNQLPGTIPEHADVASTSSSAAGDTSAGTNGATPTGRRATAEDVATDSSAEMGRTWKSWLGRSASTINGTASPTGAAGTPRGAAGVGEKVGSYDTVADIRRVKNASDLANVKGLALQFIEQRDSEQLRASRGAGGGSGGVDVMSDLIDAKVQLADSDFQIQELKRELHKEKARSRLLSSRLTSLQAKHELLRNANE